MRSGTHGTDRPGYGVLGMGMYVPQQVVTSAEVAAAAGVTEEWVVAKTGVRQRRRAAVDESTADLGAEAGRRALKHARDLALTAEAADDPGMLLVATSTPDRQVPAPVSDVHARIGLPPLPTLSIDGGCAGFAQAMVTAAAYHEIGVARTALVVGAHRIRNFLVPSDARTAPLFGDGAGAYLMGPVPPGYGMLAYRMMSDSSHVDALRTPYRTPDFTGPDRLFMDGHGLVEVFVRELPELLSQCLDEAGATVDEIDHLFVHQANVQMVRALGGLLGLSAEKVPTSGEWVANTASASLAIGTVMAARARPIRRGDLVVMITAGAGANGVVIVTRWF
ncbi:3-oxoacyl-ACP synthase III family protein [Rhodococcus sp. NPDC127528]|uniref:3-oxoacyl-ACP synthase III family protein n=1 Tax=unclassified Rhodococcus (in: high G+C Gram-positive bacteria) TaxID=192944 RepID=UPI0036426620